MHISMHWEVPHLPLKLCSFFILFFFLFFGLHNLNCSLSSVILSSASSKTVSSWTAWVWIAWLHLNADFFSTYHSLTDSYSSNSVVQGSIPWLKTHICRRLKTQHVQTQHMQCWSIHTECLQWNFNFHYCIFQLHYFHLFFLKNSLW